MNKIAAILAEVLDYANGGHILGKAEPTSERRGGFWGHCHAEASHSLGSSYPGVYM